MHVGIAAAVGVCFAAASVLAALWSRDRASTTIVRMTAAPEIAGVMRKAADRVPRRV
jgi:hypothetical protein